MKKRIVFILSLILAAELIFCVVMENRQIDIPSDNHETTPCETTTISITEPPTTPAPTTTPIPTTTPPTTPAPTTTPTPTTTPAPTYDFDPDDLELIAIVIYQEAGGNMHCDECRRRVADVVLNRVADDRFPDTIHGVLTEKNQYGRFYSTGVVWPSRASKPEEASAVARAWRIAEEVMMGHHSDLYGKGYIWQATFKQGKDNIYCCEHYFGR